MYYEYYIVFYNQNQDLNFYKKKIHYLLLTIHVNLVF